jgi:uncharacterized alpha-E superfamily protein
LLARTVESVYWLSRYLERAENTARIIGVNTNLMLDLPGGIAPGWLPLVDISGSRSEYDELYAPKAARGEEREVVQFLVADRTNPGSICSSLMYARENARTLREILPTEAWELLNEFIDDCTFETVQWMSVLKSLSGYQMYRLRMRSRVKRADVLHFLLRDDQFPRSCQFCLMQLERSLNDLPRNEGVLEVLAAAARFIERAPVATLDQPGLHELIDRLQLHINNVHGMIAGIYFPSHVGEARRLPSQSPMQSQTQRQTSLSFGAALKA